MADDHRRRAVRQRAFDQHAWMHLGAIDAALEQFLETECAMAGVEVQGREHFARLPAQAAGEVAAGGGGVGECVAAFQLRGQVAMSQLQRRGQGAGARVADAVQPGHVLRAAVEQGAQRAVFGQQVAGGGHRVAAGGAGAEEQRQQFGVGQAACAARQQLFAGTFMAGPVADMHGRRMRARRDLRHRPIARLRVS